jgi:serine/threonine-protein kinase haspin
MSRLSTTSASLSLAALLDADHDRDRNRDNIIINSDSNNVTHQKMIDRNSIGTINTTTSSTSSTGNGTRSIQSAFASPSSKSRKPVTRLTMQSYFDKENRFTDKSPCKSTLDTTSPTSTSTSTPLKVNNHAVNTVNRISLSDSLNGKSQASSSRSNSRLPSYKRQSLGQSQSQSQSQSRRSYSSYKSTSSSATATTHESSRDGTEKRYSKLSSNDSHNDTTPAVEDFVDGVAKLNMHAVETITIASTTSVSTPTTAITGTTSATVIATPAPVVNEKPERKSIRKSTSFASIRHSLSMRSLTSTLRNDREREKEKEPSEKDAERRNSLKSKRKMSLDNIRSFLTNNRYSMSYEPANDYKNNISLPIMQPETKDKIRHKLRNSSSIVSINSFASTTDNSNNDNNNNNISKNNINNTHSNNHSNGNNNRNGDSAHVYSTSQQEFQNRYSNAASTVPTTKKLKPINVNQLQFNLLLKLCSQTRAVSFKTYMNKFQSSNMRKHLTLLSNTSSNNLIFMEFTYQDYSSTDVNLVHSGVWKIMPLDVDGKGTGASVSNTIQELALTMSMSNKRGFVNITSSKVVYGPCPASIAESLDNEDEEVMKMAQSSSQLFLIVRLDYAGVTLKDFKLESWQQASQIFTQLIEAMTLAERDHYEHRDLSSSNVLIDTENTDNSYPRVTIIDHALARGVVSNQLMYRDLYDADFFKGSGEYHHTIYKYMRRAATTVIPTKMAIPNSMSTTSINTVGTDMTTMTNHSSTTLSTTTTVPGSASSSADWSKSYPMFNLLWTHYILHTLIFEKGLKPLKMSPILKRQGRLAAGGGDVAAESEAYERLIQGYRMVDPGLLLGKRKNRYVVEVHSVAQFRDWWASRNA